MDFQEITEQEDHTFNQLVSVTYCFHSSVMNREHNGMCNYHLCVPQGISGLLVICGESSCLRTMSNLCRSVLRLGAFIFSCQTDGIMFIGSLGGNTYCRNLGKLHTCFKVGNKSKVIDLIQVSMVSDISQVKLSLPK